MAYRVFIDKAAEKDIDRKEIYRILGRMQRSTR
jgi:hypothetical protein